MNINQINFTKSALTALPAALSSKRYTVYDRRRRGLCLLVTATGVKTFYVLRKFRRRTERVLVGRFPDTTVEQARRRAGQVNSAMDAGTNPNELKRKERGELTVDDLFQDYLVRHVRQHNRRPDKAEYNYAKYVSRLGNRKLSAVTRPDLRDWHAKLGEDHGTRTANIGLTLLRAMFNRARDWELFTAENPTNGIRKYHENSRERFLLPDEVKRFLVSLRADPDPDARDFFLVLLFTGARKYDVLKMRWHDLNLGSGVWVIPDTKIGEAVTIPLSEPALAVLRERSESRDGEWVFPGSGKTGHFVEPKKAWARILKRAGIEGLWMHDLRRTLGSWMAGTGANLSVIGKALGHRNLTTTTRYARVDLTPIRIATEAAAAALLIADAAPPKPQQAAG